MFLEAQRCLKFKIEFYEFVVHPATVMLAQQK